LNKVHFSSQNNNWGTPEKTYDELDKEFHFNFDPCPQNPLYDGLNIDWGKRNFVNPPYSELKLWAKKAYEESLIGKLIVLLVPSRTDTRYWHDYFMRADEIRFIRGRLKFQGAKNSAPFPSAIIVFKGRQDGKQTRRN